MYLPLLLFIYNKKGTPLEFLLCRNTPVVRENITDYFTLQLSFNGTEHTFSINFWGAIMKKTKIKLDDMERRILVKLLYE